MILRKNNQDVFKTHRPVIMANVIQRLQSQLQTPKETRIEVTRGE